MMKGYREILVSFDVWKAIQQDRASFEEIEDYVLRRKYGLAIPPRPETIRYENGSALTSKGGELPNGLGLVSRSHKGRRYEAVVNNGKIWLNEQPYPSPSAAAYAITKHPVNGWSFWGIMRLGKWEPLTELRRDKK